MLLLILGSTKGDALREAQLPLPSSLPFPSLHLLSLSLFAAAFLFFTQFNSFGGKEINCQRLRLQSAISLGKQSRG